MRLVQFYHSQRLHRLARHPDLHLFEFSIWLHTLARSLIAVFIPILLLQSGYSLHEVILFYLIFNIIDVPLNFPADWLIRKLGAKKVIILGTIATIAFFGLLGVLPGNNWPLLILLAFLAAVYDTLFWIAHIYVFIETTREKIDAGKAVGALEGVRRFANVVGPLAGALLFITGGKLAITLGSIAVFALSIIPLFKFRHVRDLPRTKFIPPQKFFQGKTEKRDYLSMALWGMHSEADEVWWPVFIFFIFGTIESVAAVPMIVSLTTAALSYLAGVLTKRHGYHMIIVGCILLASVWLLRLMIHDPIFYYVTVFLTGFLALLVTIPIDGSITARGLKLDSLSASTYRNAIGMAGQLTFYLILFLLVGVFQVSFVLAVLSLFLIVAITSLLGVKKPRSQMV